MNNNEMLSEFTRSRLLGYAQLLSQIVDDYMGRECEMADISERALLLKEHENGQSRIILGNFMLDAAGHLERLAHSRFSETAVQQRQRARLVKELKTGGILLHDYYRTQNRNGYEEIGMIVSGSGHDYYDVFEIAELLSGIVHKSMLPLTDGRHYIHQEKVALCFQEEVRFQFFSGYAKATKDEEEISGDNFLLREFGDGTYIAAIADGMGSGEAACESSEKVLELLERFVEAGLGVEDFRRTCNGFVYMRRDLEQSVTLDVLECNQYTGEGVFFKNGGCSSFLIRGDRVREIAPDKLAFGIKMYAGGSQETVFFESGDRIVMLSDGVMDFYAQRVELLYDLLLCRDCCGPNELAADILKNAVIGCEGKMPDDMTVLAIRAEEKDDI